MKAILIFLQWLTPSKLFIWSTIIFAIWTLLGIPISSAGYPGGEQRPMVLFAYTLSFASYYFLVLSILTTFLYWDRTKRHWLAQLTVLLASVAMVLIGNINR
jgi:hypothetical protein